MKHVLMLLFMVISPLRAQLIRNPKVLDLYDRAEALLGEGNADAAEKIVQEADKQACGDCVPCLKLMFSIHLQQAKHVAAFQDLNRLLEKVDDPNRLGAQYLMLGYTVAQKEPLSPQDNQLARDILEKALTTSKKTTLAHLHLSQLYDQARDKQKALSHLESLLLKKPEDQLSGALRQQIGEWKLKLTGQLSYVPIETLDGSAELDFTKYRGQVVLVDYWASWCGPCRTSQPGLMRFYKKFADRPFKLISISVDKEPQAAIDYVAKSTMVWPQYYDRYGNLSGKLLDIGNSYPSFKLVDHEGRIIHSEVGWRRSAERRLNREISKALTKAEEAVKESSP